MAFTGTAVNGTATVTIGEHACKPAAWKQGWRDRLDRQPGCPFNLGTQERRDWQDGFREAHQILLTMEAAITG